MTSDNTTMKEIASKNNKGWTFVDDGKGTKVIIRK